MTTPVPEVHRPRTRAWRARGVTKLAVAVLALLALTAAPASSRSLVEDTTDAIEDASLTGAASPGTLELGGVECNLVAVPTATPVGTGPCGGVRPGALVETPVGYCSFNFLFLGSDGKRYMGTAGHCIVEDDDEQVWAAGTGPVARDGSGNRIGEFAYAVLGGEKDFALIRLDHGVAASPQMCHFGGPTSLNTSNPRDPVVLHHYGQGLGVSEVVPARSALALGMPDDDHVFAEGTVVFGDSGSGIISADGGAVGVIVTTGIHAASIGTDGVDAGTMGVTRLAPQLAQATSLTGVTYFLQTAPLL